MARRKQAEKRQGPLPYGGAPGTGQRVRTWMVMLGLLLGFGIMAVQLGRVHLNPRNELSAEDRLHIGEIPIELPRGNIYDRNQVVLATDRRAPSLWADPRRVRQAPDLAALISLRLKLNEAVVFERLCKRDSDGELLKFVWLKRWLTDTPPEVIQEIITKSGGAVAIRHEPVRYYPQRDTAAHLLGFVNRVGEACEGVEAAFDERLRSVPGMKTARKTGARKLLESLTIEHTKAQGGDDLVLSIDTVLQHHLEEALDRRMAECNAPRAMGLLMDPNTGAILALASRPAFDPNAYDQFDPALRKNCALTDVFEPGSAFKIVPASAVLERELVTAQTMIDCEGGRFNPYGHSISDFHPHDIIPFSECFAESSNIAMVKVAALLGPEQFENWLVRFGFGERTSRDFAAESRGILRARRSWSRLSMGALPIGQEIAVTMPQLARAFAAIANGGYLVEPHFVDRAVGRDGAITYLHQPPPTRRILSARTAQVMRDLCHQVVMEGTGDEASIPEYRVGGKTGTAQMQRRDGPGYDPDRYTTVFAGFAPVVQPRVVAVIVVPEPMIRLHYGGHVCGPVFKEVVRHALIRMNVPEDPVLDADGRPITEAAMGEAPVTVAAVDADTIVEPPDPFAMELSLTALMDPLDGLELVASPADGLVVGEGLPDFRGQTKRQAKKALEGLGLPWDLHGAGWVVAQSPAPGTPLNDIAVCVLEFGRVSAEKQDETRRTG